MNERFLNCLPFDENLKGRIGGNPPETIEALIPEGYLFYLTIVHPDKPDKMLSIAIQQDYEKLIENNQYPNTEVRVIEHSFSKEGNCNEKSIQAIKKASIGEEQFNVPDFMFIKMGGEPRFIQYKEYYYQPLIDNNYSFFLQVDEEGYPDDLLDGDYPFGYGALYLYKQNETNEVIAGFWQYS